MMAAVISGQGRMLVLFGQDLNRDVITEVCYFLCGECSYRIKAMNPGMDLLMAVNWKESIIWYPEPVKTYLPSGVTFSLSDTIDYKNGKVDDKRDADSYPHPLDVNQDTSTDESLLKILLVFIVLVLLIIFIVGRFVLRK